MMERDLRLDGLKFFLIFLVVLGHLKYGDHGLRINKIIYSFHMPVFVFLSGYFTSSYPSLVKIKAWFKHTILLYIIAQIAHIFLSLILNNPITWKVLIDPQLALWYLVCLMYWRFFVWFILKNVSSLGLLFFSFLFLILCGFVPIDHDFSFQRAFAFLPFFIIGFLFRRNNMMSFFNDISIICAIVILIMGLIMARFLPFYMPKVHFSSLNEAFVRIIQTCLGILLCFSIIKLSRARLFERIAKYGRYSIWIYIGHTYLIVIGQRIFSYYGITINFFEAILLALIYCSFFIYLAKLFENRKKRLVAVSTHF